jgi:hypothetical protein
MQFYNSDAQVLFPHYFFLKCTHFHKSHGSVVRIASGYGLDECGVGVRVLVR